MTNLSKPNKQQTPLLKTITSDNPSSPDALAVMASLPDRLAKLLAEINASRDSPQPALFKQLLDTLRYGAEDRKSVV